MADIPQPKGNKVVSNNISVEIVWSSDFKQRKQAMFTRMQKFIDSECLRQMVQYTPMLNGALYKSGTLGTVIGSGKIEYNSPYARYQYYGKLMVSSVTGSAWASYGESKVLTDVDLKYNTFRHPQAGSYWFERMKRDKLAQIKRGAERIAQQG